MRLEIDLDALAQLRGDLSILEGRGEAIAAACNADSDWGGYHATEVEFDGHTSFQRVYAADGRNDEARDQRLIKNLDRGR